jgi:hypothetical protein
VRFPGGDEGFISLSLVGFDSHHQYQGGDNPMKRREFLKILGIGAAVASFPLTLLAPETTPAVAAATDAVPTTTLGGVVSGAAQVGELVRDVPPAGVVQDLEFPRDFAYVGIKWTAPRSNGTVGDNVFGDYIKLGTIDNRCFRQGTKFLYNPDRVTCDPVTWEMVEAAKEALYEASVKKYGKMSSSGNWAQHIEHAEFVVAPSLKLMTDVVEASMRYE